VPLSTAGPLVAATAGALVAAGAGAVVAAGAGSVVAAGAGDGGPGAAPDEVGDGRDADVVGAPETEADGIGAALPAADAPLTPGVGVVPAGGEPNRAPDERLEVTFV
jgi:hypothetical protein